MKLRLLGPSVSTVTTQLLCYWSDDVIKNAPTALTRSRGPAEGQLAEVQPSRELAATAFDSALRNLFLLCTFLCAALGSAPSTVTFAQLCFLKEQYLLQSAHMLLFNQVKVSYFYQQ